MRIKVLVIEPNKAPYEKEIEDGLASLQNEVGGMIQAIYPFEEEVAIICNDEGKLEGLPLNRALRDQNEEVYDILVGTFLVAGLTEDSFGSLSEEHMKKFSEYYAKPEIFVNFDGHIIAVPFEQTPPAVPTIDEVPYKADDTAPLMAALTNLGKYNEGELVYKWIHLPISDKELSQVLKDICLQGAIVVLACIIYSAFVTTPPENFDSSLSAVQVAWNYLGEIIFNMLVLVGAVKMSEKVVKEMIGF